MKFRKSVLVDSLTKKHIYLPEFSEGEEGFEEQQKIREMAQASVEDLLELMKT